MMSRFNCLNNYLNNFQGKKVDPDSYVYTTFIMCGQEYVPGALTLAESLRVVDPDIERYLIYTEDVDVSELRESFICIKVPYLSIKCKPLPTHRMRRNYGSWIDKSFTKLNIFNPNIWPLGFNKKIIYIDADQTCVGDMSHLSLLDTPAIGYGSQFIQGNPANLYSLKHGDRVNPWEIGRWMNNLQVVCASGVMVLYPNAPIFQHVLRLMKPNFGYNLRNGYEEQILLKTFVDLQINSFHIDGRYYHNLYDISNVVCINYFGHKKPWHESNTIYPDTFIFNHFFLLSYLRRHHKELYDTLPDMIKRPKIKYEDEGRNSDELN